MNEDDVIINKITLFTLMASHMKLTSEEYRMNPSYNNTHYSHIAEDFLVAYFDEHNPELLKEFFKWKDEK